MRSACLPSASSPPSFFHTYQHLPCLWLVPSPLKYFQTGIACSYPLPFLSAHPPSSHNSANHCRCTICVRFTRSAATKARDGVQKGYNKGICQAQKTQDIPGCFMTGCACCLLACLPACCTAHSKGLQGALQGPSCCMRFCMRCIMASSICCFAKRACSSFRRRSSS